MIKVTIMGQKELHVAAFAITEDTRVWVTRCGIPFLPGVLPTHRASLPHLPEKHTVTGQCTACFCLRDKVEKPRACLPLKAPRNFTEISHEFGEISPVSASGKQLMTIETSSFAQLDLVSGVVNPITHG